MALPAFCRCFIDPSAAQPALIRALEHQGKFNGVGRVAGTVKVAGTPDAPVFRRVRLFAKRGGEWIRETWSNPDTGEYAFDYVMMNEELFIIAHDHTGVYNAVISDSIFADPMP